MKLSFKRAQSYLTQGLPVYCGANGCRNRVIKIIRHNSGGVTVTDAWGERITYPPAGDGLNANITFDDGSQGA